MTKPEGSRFTQIYVEQAAPLPDSPKARRRVGSTLQTIGGYVTNRDISLFLETELGINVPVYQAYDWPEQTIKLSLHDFLDTITLVTRHLARSNTQVSARWLQAVQRIFSEEGLAYEIDAKGGVHPAVDVAFQRNRQTAVAGLQSPRYQNALQSFERISSELAQQPPNGKEAIRAIWSAVEGLFRLMFPKAAQLNAGEVADKLAPIIQTAFAQDATAIRAANKLLNSFKNWVDACHNYRHEPGTQEPAQPPLELAIITISQGTSFLRWLISLDQRMPKS